MNSSKANLSKKEEYRKRAQRLIAGDFHIEDLNRLLLFLRENSFGNKNVREIGDMIAHGDTREKGISFQHVSDKMELIEFKLPHIEAYPSIPEISLEDAPRNFLPAMEACLRLMDTSTIRTQLNMNKRSAERSLRRIKSQFFEKENGCFALRGYTLSQAEQKLIKVLTSMLSGASLYTGDQLFDEIEKLLVRHKFIDKNQAPQLLARKPHILLFAIERMHLVEFPLTNGKRVVAQAGWDLENGLAKLNVYISHVISWQGSNRTIISLLFSTDLSAEEWAPEFNPLLGSKLISCPIEMTSEPRLRLLKDR
jgi:hypothetical protein